MKRNSALPPSSAQVRLPLTSQMAATTLIGQWMCRKMPALQETWHSSAAGSRFSEAKGSLIMRRLPRLARPAITSLLLGSVTWCFLSRRGGGSTLSRGTQTSANHALLTLLLTSSFIHFSHIFCIYFNTVVAFYTSLGCKWYFLTCFSAIKLEIFVVSFKTVCTERETTVLILHQFGFKLVKTV